MARIVAIIGGLVDPETRSYARENWPTAAVERFSQA